MTDIITLIQSAILIIAAFLVLLAAYGILRYRDDIENVIYARIHISRSYRYSPYSSTYQP